MHEGLRRWRASARSGLAALLLMAVPGQVEAGEATPEDRAAAAMEQWEAAFLGEGPMGGCGSAAMHAVHAAWDVLSEEQRAVAREGSAPIDPAWGPGAAGLAGTAGAAGSAASAGARDTCFPPEDLDGFSSYEFAQASSHFAVYRVSGAAPQASLVQDVLELLEEALADFTSRGWQRPAGIDDFEMVVFLDQRPATLGGFTWVSPCASPGDGAMDWVVLNEAWAADPELAGPLIAHELFHTIQRRYSSAELVQGWESSANRWFAEASAVYEEGLVFPGRTELTTARSAFWGERPWLALDTFDGRREYQMFVLLLAVEAVLGEAWHQRLWEGVQDRTGWTVPGELDGLAAESGGFAPLFREYIARAAEMDLPRVDFLVGPRDLQAFTGIDGGLSARYAATELPLAGEVLAEATEAPQSGGVNYVWFGTTAAEPGRALRLDFEGDALTPDGEATDWAVEVVAARAGAMVQRLSVSPDPEDPRARVLVHGVGENLDGVWLIASPTGEFEGAAPGWSWSARLVRGEDELRMEEAAPGCGCSASGRSGSWAWLPLAVLLGRRRRGRA